MSRVTKLQKHYRRLSDAKWNRRSRHWAKNKRLRYSRPLHTSNWRNVEFIPLKLDSEFLTASRARVSAVLAAFAVVGNVDALDMLP
jgi:hypothetical protein